MAGGLIPGKYILFYQSSSGGFLRGGFEHYRVFRTATEVRTNSTNKKIRLLYKFICNNICLDPSMFSLGDSPIYVLKCNKMGKENSTMYYDMTEGKTSTNGYEDLIGNYESVAVGPIEENNDKWSDLINQINNMKVFERQFVETGVVPNTSSYIKIKDEYKHIIKNNNPKKYYFQFVSAVAQIGENKIVFEP